MPSLVTIGPVVLEKKFFEFHQFIFAISLSSPVSIGHDPHLNKLKSSSSNNALCTVG